MNKRLLNIISIIIISVIVVIIRPLAGGWY